MVYFNSVLLDVRVVFWMNVIISEHAWRRLQEDRQQQIQINDVLAAAASIPGRIKVSTRFRNFIAGSGRRFDLVVKDSDSLRIVITIIGK